MKKLAHRFSRFTVLTLVVLASNTAMARDYLVEVILFETVAARNMDAGGLYYPNIENSLELGSSEAVQAGFLQTDQALSLTENAAEISASGRYRLISHFAWRQPGLDDASAVPVHINLGETSRIYLPEDLSPYETFFPASFSPTPEYTRPAITNTVNGTIRVRLGRFLHMDAQLIFTDPETQQGFRLSQSRKMRSRELHYIDNPRFGILTRILPLDDTAGPSSQSSEG